MLHARILINSLYLFEFILFYWRDELKIKNEYLLVYRVDLTDEIWDKDDRRMKRQTKIS